MVHDISENLGFKYPNITKLVLLHEASYHLEFILKECFSNLLNEDFYQSLNVTFIREQALLCAFANLY